MSRAISDALLDEPKWVDGPAGPEPHRWWDTRKYRAFAQKFGGKRFSSAKHAVTPEDDDK